MRALVTGGAGFVGRHLVSLLLDEGCLVWSVDRRPGVPPGARSFEGDLLASGFALQIATEVRPDLVFHLAARTPANAPASTPTEWLGGDPVATHGLLDAVQREAPRARVLVVSSSAVYGNAETMPISESCPQKPTGLYGVTKATVELVAQSFHTTHGLDVVRARPFNLLGPGEPPGMLTSTLAAQVAQIRSGSKPAVVRMRHRATSRDYLDVRDAVRAYWLLLQLGAPGEVYNVCSGRATAIGELARRLIDLAGVSATIEETAPIPLTGDVVTQVGDATRIAAATGWTAQIPLDRSLADLL